MSESIPSDEAVRSFSTLVNRSAFSRERFVITRHGKPLVALVSLDDLRKLEKSTAAGETKSSR